MTEEVEKKELTLDEFDKELDRLIELQIAMARKQTEDFVGQLKPLIHAVNAMPQEQQHKYGLILISSFEKLHKGSKEIERLYDNLME